MQYLVISIYIYVNIWWNISIHAIPCNKYIYVNIWWNISIHAIPCNKYIYMLIYDEI